MMSGRIEQKLRELGIELPPVPAVPPNMNFVMGVRTGNQLFVVGGPLLADGKLAYRGKVPTELSLEVAYQAARLTALNLLATMQQQLGSLDRVLKIVKLTGFVNGTDDFEQQPAVINGASDLLIQVFGPEIGKHTRSAIGVNGLAGRMPVEIELVVEIKESQQLFS